MAGGPRRSPGRMRHRPTPTPGSRMRLSPTSCSSRTLFRRLRPTTGRMSLPRTDPEGRMAGGPRPSTGRIRHRLTPTPGSRMRHRPTSCSRRTLRRRPTTARASLRQRGGSRNSAIRPLRQHNRTRRRRRISNGSGLNQRSSVQQGEQSLHPAKKGLRTSRKRMTRRNDREFERALDIMTVILALATKSPGGNHGKA
jgi:hypothetical protein